MSRTLSNKEGGGKRRSMWVWLCGYNARSSRLSYSRTFCWLSSTRKSATVLRNPSASEI